MPLRSSALVMALLLLASGLAHADQPTALEEMRGAAERAAEVDPDRLPTPPRIAPPARGAAEEARREVQQAVRAEIDREWSARAPGRRPFVTPPGKGGQPPGQSVSAEARSEAAQAQGAARGRSVAAERGKGHSDDPPGKGYGRIKEKGSP